jgi:hypothetical protein
MPIPTQWVPVFMDGPSVEDAIGRLNVLVNNKATQEQLDDYAPFIYMMTTASCALKEDSNLSVMAIEASKLDYQTQVRATAEELWNCSKNPSKVGMGKNVGATVTNDNNCLKNPSKFGMGNVVAENDLDAGKEYRWGNSDREDNNEINQDSDTTAVGRAKSQQPYVVTPPQRADKRWQQ